MILNKAKGLSTSQLTARQVKGREAGRGRSREMREMRRPSLHWGKTSELTISQFLP